MQYFIAFLEGIITFISPCLLPMLPVYVSYLAGGAGQTRSASVKNALGFICGFTIVFLVLGGLAGTVGGFLKEYQTAVNIVTGLIVMVFGLSFTGVFSLPFFGGGKFKVRTEKMNFFSALLFGVVFSVSWTPCVGAFLGAALMMASQQGQVLAGLFMLLLYSLGLGIPFLIAALLLDQLKGAFNAVKRHYREINIVCGVFLVLIGILMATGQFGRFLALLS